MSKKILAIALAMMMLFLVGCGSNNSSGENGGDMNNLGGESGGDMNNSGGENGSDMNNSGGENGSTTRGDEFVLKAVVKAVKNGTVEAEVIESDYAFGVYWILTPSTKYYNKNGSQITRQSITVGETVEISYSGQTMLSFPPQVVAYQIRLAN